MAERLGFEPRKELPPCRFSRPVHSTALSSLQLHFYENFNIFFDCQIQLLIITPFYTNFYELHEIKMINKKLKYQLLGNLENMQKGHSLSPFHVKLYF